MYHVGRTINRPITLCSSIGLLLDRQELVLLKLLLPKKVIASLYFGCYFFLASFYNNDQDAVINGVL
jgi:hypothetical protein